MLELIFIVLIWGILFILGFYFCGLKEIALVLSGVLATITSNIIYRWYVRPIIKIGNLFKINGSSGTFYLISLANEGKSILKNCSAQLYIEGKLNDRDIFLDGILPWSPSLKKGFLDINIRSKGDIDLFFIPKNSKKLKVPTYQGYNNFIKFRYKSNSEEFTDELDLSKVKKLNGKIIITSANAELKERKIIIELINDKISIK